MSQKVSTYQESYEPLDDFAASPSWSMEAYADGLMNELFSDIDGVLDGSGNLPSEPVQPEYVSLQTITVPQVVLPSALVLPNTGGVQQPAAALSTVVVDRADQQRRLSRWFGIILLVAASATAGIAALLWLTGHRGLQSELQTSLTPERQLQAKAEADAKFIDYMQRALETIDQKQVEAGQVASLPANLNNKVPTVSPGSQALVPRNPANVLERVYIPVYQPPRPNTLALPSIPLSNLPQTTAPALPRVVLPRPVVPPRPVPSRPVAPAPSATATQSSSTASTLDATHTLTGVMDLGSKSAALFAVDGVTHRIQLGESIGSTGWTLVEVANNQAVVRRNGEVRSIYVGQKL